MSIHYSVRPSVWYPNMYKVVRVVEGTFSTDCDDLDYPLYPSFEEALKISDALNKSKGR